MNLKQKAMIPVVAGIFALSAGSAYAEEHRIENLPVGAAKGVVGAIYQIGWDGPKYLGKEIDKKGLIGVLTGIVGWGTGPILKAGEEGLHAITLTNSGVLPEDEGSANRYARKNLW